MKDTLIDWEMNQKFKYDSSSKETDQRVLLQIQNLSVDKGVKDWSFESQSPTILAIYGNEEDNLTNLLRGFAGYTNIVSGEINLDNEDVTFNIPGWEKQVNYLANRQISWNKLFSVHYNLKKTARSVKPFLQEVSRYNTKTKIAISSFKNIGKNLNKTEFKNNLISLIKGFINEIQTSRNLIIKEYENQINHFHEKFAKTKFNFFGGQNLAKILIRKFTFEEKNNIANNNLLFYQSLQDRISSLENLIGDCICGCQPNKKRKKEFELREIAFVIKEVNSFLEDKIFLTRKQIRTTLKGCNNHNQVFNNRLNQELAYKKVRLSRTEIDEIIEEWVDLAEVKRIKFNMKQDFIAMQLLPDEMQLLLKNIRHEIEIYHKKLLKQEKKMDDETYNKQLQELEDRLIDVRDLINENIFYIFEILGISDLLKKGYVELSLLERKIVFILQKIVVVTKVLLLENPFFLLEHADKIKLSQWLKTLTEKLSIIIIFTTKSNEDIDLVATHICVIENDNIIQQGKINDISNEPLSLSLFKEMNKRHLNILKGEWDAPNLFLYKKKIATFPDLKNEPLIALKADDIIFIPRRLQHFNINPPLAFNLFRKDIRINGTIKNINKISENYSFLTFKTYDNNLIEVLVPNQEDLKASLSGWISIVKNTVYIFDSKTKKLIGTW